MANLITNINQVCADLTNIKKAITDTGVDIAKGTPSSEYAEKINDVYNSGVAYVDDALTETNDSLESVLYGTGDGSKSWYDKYMEALELHPEKTVSGSYISVDDVSELPHDVKCKMTGVDNPESVTVTRYGANLWEGADVYTVTGTGAAQSLFVIDEPIKTTQTFSCVVALEDVEYSATGNLVFFYATYADGTGATLSIVNTSTTSGAVRAQFTASEENPIVRVQMNAHGRFTGGTITLSDIMLNRGTFALPYEPYNEQTLTPSADGTVEGMTSVSSYMNIFTDNTDAMLDVTYRQSAGKKAEYDAFWDSFQDYGNRTNYRGAFGSSTWNEVTFRPKYQIKGTAFTSAFMFFNYGNNIIDYRNYAHLLDLSNASNSANYLFYNAWIDYLEIDLSNVTSLSSAFSEDYHGGKKTHLTLKVSDKCTYYALAFDYCTALTDLVFVEGSVIADSIHFKHSPLTKESITSVINALSTSTTGRAVTFKKTAKEAAFTAEEWAELIATKSNWTFLLV